MRLTLGLKMTLTSTLLVAIVVSFMGYFQATSIRDEHESWANKQREAFEEGAVALAEHSAGILAVATSEHIAGTELTPLAHIVRGIAEQNDDIVFVRIADHLGQVLADSRKPEITIGDFDTIPRELLCKKETEQRNEASSQILSIRRPIVRKGQDPSIDGCLGAVEFGVDMAPLRDNIDKIEAQRKDATKRSQGFTLKVGAAALIAGALLSLAQAYRFSLPIRRLANTAARIARGDLGARVKVRSSDEVGTLGVQFNHMADRVQQLVVETVAKAELEHELNLAREIQSVLVPGPGTHHAPGIEVAGHYEPASVCGGDFWDLSALPRGRSTLLIGDVTGHGVPASILTATAKGCLDTLRHVHGENIHVAETMRVLDKVIREAGHGTFFMTAACIVLDAPQSALYYASAAHPPGLLLRWTESGTKLSRLNARGNRLGDGDDSGFEARRIRVAQGDLLVWYTDGLTDATNAAGRAYSARRLLAQLSGVERHASPESIVKHIIDDLVSFREGTPLEDDVTLVVGRIT